MSNPSLLSAPRADILAALDKALADYKVAALTKKQDRTLFDYINSSKEVELEYQPTVLSPKKFFFPQEEVILEYTAEGKVTPKVAAEPQILFGVRPCDINGIKIMDEAFADGHGDPNYMAKRENTIIVGIDCKKVCDENAFCYKVKSNYADAGFDIMLAEKGDDYLVQAVTDKGEQFVAKYLNTSAAAESELEAFQEEKKQGFAGKTAFNDLDNLPEIFAKNKDHAVWDEEGSRCLSCGSCIMVCPTCYCFDVADEMALNLKEGQRLRRWDACMLCDFAEVAGGENFRHSAKARLHHRIDRKFNFLMRKHNQSVCVGCGRCVRACLADISPKTIVEKITGEEGNK